MTGQPTLAVTGSTGAVGGLVAHALAAAGVEQRLLARAPERAPELPGSLPVACTYGDQEQTRTALTGVQTLFMVSAAEAVDRRAQQLAFVDAAAESGVRHVVYTSFLGAAADCTFTLGRDHWATEQRVRASGMDFTFLRDSFYLDFIPAMVGEDGVLRGPAGQGRLAGVSRADVAACAVTVLRDPTAHRGRTYDLTGPEALTLAEMAALVGAARGEPVTYLDETLEQAYASRASYGAPDWQVDAWVTTYTAIAKGEVARVSDDVRTLTGRQPDTLQDVLGLTAGA